MNRGLFDFDRISPDIEGPSFLSPGGGYPNEVQSKGRIDVIGGGSVTRKELGDIQAAARPGYPMIGGFRAQRTSRTQRVSRAQRTSRIKRSTKTRQNKKHRRGSK